MNFAFPVIAVLILSLVVRYWPGQPAPAWVNIWIDRLWLLFGLTFGVGIVLAFVYATKTELPNGAFHFVAATPKQIQYVLAAIYIPLAILALVGAAYVVRSGVRTLSIHLSQADGKIRLRRIGLSLAVALAAVTVSWAFGGPLTFSSQDGL